LRPLLRSRETETLRADLSSGARIANARGIPGSVGFLAVTRHDRQLVIVTAHHVLFGDGAREGGAVWLVTDTSTGLRYRRVGRSLYGRAGVVRHDATDAYVDCAVASVDDDDALAADWPIEEELIGSATLLAPGDRLTKSGGATGTTEGVVVEIDYRANGLRRGPLDAPRQILIRSAAVGHSFSADGDSGAALLDARGEIVGLLWAVTPRGDGIACPIAHVLYVLNLVPARLKP
jgi:hypothetical protein